MKYTELDFDDLEDESRASGMRTKELLAPADGLAGAAFRVAVILAGLYISDGCSRDSKGYADSQSGRELPPSSRTGE